MEAIASNCGFNINGGSRNHVSNSFEQDKGNLSKYLRFSWLPKIGNGFFFRAETLLSFTNGLDKLAEDPMIGQSAYSGVGGKTLKVRSHGESFFELFKNQFGSRGIYILDEPEAALSPQRQLDLLKIIQKLSVTGECQFIISTHSPLLMAIPNADLKFIKKDKFVSCEFHETEHFKIMRDFYMCPDNFIQGALIDE